MDQNITRDTSMDVKSMMAQRQAELNAQSQEVNQVEYKDGDYIPGENGEAGGFLIDTEEQLKRATEIPQINDIKKYINNQQDQINRIQNGENPHDVLGVEQPTKSVEDLNVSRAGVQDAHQLKKVRDAFASMEMTATGLAPAGSPEAEEYKRKMEALERGEVNLEDYRNVKPQPRQYDAAPQQPVQQQTQAQYAAPQDNTIQFNVPSENTKEFISTLDKSDREKIQRSSTIIVNEIKELTIPTATRTISSMDEYKRIAPRSVYSDVVECVLLNSGYIATVKGCGSLAMATIIPDDPNMPPDLNKRYQFCYENLVTTSIGKLSLQEFIAHTSVADIPTLLFNILRASETDDQTITLICGADSCHKEYEVQYKMSQLIDTDKITEEMSQQIDTIVNARNVQADAKRVHESSPVMLRKYMQMSSPDKTIVVELKSPDGTIAIERSPLLASISRQYSRFILGLLMYIPKIYLTFTLPNETEPKTYEVTDPYVIAENLGELNEESVRAIANMIENMQEFPSMSYSFKGEYRCPNCGRVETSVPCDVDTLIFFRVQKAIR